jgi:hypothetical protein
VPGVRFDKNVGHVAWSPTGFAQALEQIAERYPAVEVGSYPFLREGRYGASIVVRGTDGAAVDAALAEITARLAPG